MSLYGEYCRPKLAGLLEAFSLDAEYVRAEGDYIWRKMGKRSQKVLDLVGGFGANLLGHHHPKLLAELRKAIRAKRPFHAQGSCRIAAAMLGQKLAGQLGDYISILTNSGAETVEASLKHIMMNRAETIIWALKGSFHGKTLGAIQITDRYRDGFSSNLPVVRFLEWEHPEKYKTLEGEAGNIAAIYIEPILGEGGVKPLPAHFVDWLCHIQQQYGTAIVVDEIQTGMGRTGTFLASDTMPFKPDYICLGKSLGGSLVKIGALLIARHRLKEDFVVKHTSTFAEDDISCYVAMRVLSLLEEEGIPARCARSGEYFIGLLSEVASKHPSIIEEVRGRGLMVGVALKCHMNSPSNVFHLLSEQGYFPYLAAAYLLNRHAVRVAPTLSDHHTIRLQPSAFISIEEMQRCAKALDTMCEAMESHDILHLTGFQIGKKSTPVRRKIPAPPVRQVAGGRRKVAFIAHLLKPSHAADWDNTLDALSPSELEMFMSKPSKILGPSTFERINIRSDTGDEVHLLYIALDLTPKQIFESLKNGNSDWIIRKIQQSVSIALVEGANVIGLGGYTSIVTCNGKLLSKGEAYLTTGNSLTAGMGIEALQQAAIEHGIRLEESELGVVGATGSIATIYAQLMAPLVKSVLLVVRDMKSPRAKSLAREILRQCPQKQVALSEDLKDLNKCALIVSASNSPEAIIYPEHLNLNTTVICDIALPSDVHLSVRKARPDVTVLEGGIVRVPNDPQFCIRGMPLGKGHMYACMAETVLSGLEKYEDEKMALVSPANVRRMMAVAKKHGFVLGKLSHH